MKKLLISTLLSGIALSTFATEDRNRGAIDNLCQNLTLACQGGDQSSCKAYKNTGCLRVESQGTCTRGNYSN